MATKLYLAYDWDSLEIAERLKERLDNYLVMTSEIENSEQKPFDLFDDEEFEFDGYVFLISQNSVLSNDFTYSLKKAIKISKARQNFLIPIVIGKFPLPSFLSDVPVGIVDYSNSQDKTLSQIVNIIDKWIDQDVYNSVNSLSKDELKFFKNLFVNLNSVNSVSQTKNLLYLNDWIDEFWKKIDSNPKFMNNILVEKILEKLNILEKDLKSIGSEYYFLKINAATWIISELIPGKISRFHTHDLQGNRRVDYDLFKDLKVGDQAIGYVFQEYKAVMCVFEVIQSLNLDQQHGEGITLNVRKQISPSIPLVHFKDQIEFFEKLGPNNSERIFKISKSLFDLILDTKVVGKRIEPNHDKDAGFSGDMDFENTFDQLDFQNDINSFASIIALEKVKPPLAIGLFGEWGSGKSFFMQKLSEKITKLSEKSKRRYVKNIVQVKFNAWHYSDGNLWASLVTHIFEELNSYAQVGKFNEESVKDLYARLDLTSIAITEKQDQISIVGNQLIDIETEKKELEDVMKDKKSKLTMLSNHDIIGVIFKDPSIQGVVRMIKKDEPTSVLISNLEEIEERLDEYNSLIKRILEAYLMFTKTGKWWKVWTVLLIISIGLFFLFFPPFKEKIYVYVAQLISISGAFIAFLKGFEWLKPHLKTVNKYYNRLKRLKNSIETKAEELRYSESLEIQKLESEIAKISEKEIALNRELEEKKYEKTRLEGKIEDIGTGRLIANFLAGKSKEEGYNNELGIISRIRKDFTQLNMLFTQQRDVKDVIYDKGERFQIDRIILYIDDLDRCSSEVVTKTLEAVHLLLAFELFVVVVGVDSRWLKSSLLEKYSYFSDDKKGNVSNHITSFDYLEKIFQIPFTIKAVTDKGRKKLIHFLTEADLEQNEMEKRYEHSEISMINDEVYKEDGIKESFSIEDEESLISVEKIDDLTDLKDEEFALEIEERITLSIEEIEAMQNISFLYGHTPRKIKRYVNIYRIIKAHRNYSISAVYSKNDYLPTMVTLAIVVGFPEYIKELREILHKDSQLGFGEFIKLVNCEKLKFLLEGLSDDIKSTIDTTSLLENFELISRFSFRTN